MPLDETLSAGDINHVETHEALAIQHNLYEGHTPASQLAAATAAAVAAIAAAPTFVYKTADESVTSSTTLQDDDHLFFPIVANGIYAFSFMLWGIAATAGDFQMKFLHPGSSLYYWLGAGINEAGSSVVMNGMPIQSSVLLFGGGANAYPLVHGQGVVIADGTGGTFKMQWAQNGSSGTASILKAGSWLSYKKLN